MHVLESTLARARDGNAQVVGIVGDAGLGKSRLSFEFLERCRSHNLMTYETTGLAHGKATPLVPILKLFRAFFGITDQDSAITARERIAGRLLLLDEKLRESLPLNFDFLGYPDPENPPPPMDADARQRQMFDIVRRVTQARGQKETQVILLEDLHWFDGASAAYLEPLIEAAVGTRTLVVLNFRPEFQAPWMGKSYYLQLPLGPLGPDAIRELLDALLGKDPSIKGLAEAIHARTAGNPFYTEEVVQHLIDTGKLQGTKGAYKLITPVSKLEVPSSVHALLAARIDRLAEREKDVLQTAAVIGREFDEPTLAAVVEQDAPQLREALQKLKDTEFVYEESLYPVAEYLFKHPLTQEVGARFAAAGEAQEAPCRGRAGHRGSARLGPRWAVGPVGAHWEHAGDLALAVHWHRRAAEWVSSRDPVESLKHWRKVRDLGHSLQDDTSRESRLRAGIAVLGGSWRIGMSEDEVQGCLSESRLLAQELGRPSAIAASLASYAVHEGMNGRVGKGLGIAEEAVGLINDSLTIDEIFWVECSQAYCFQVAGHVPQCIEACERIARRAGGDPQAGRAIVGFSPLIWAEWVLGWMLAQAGRFDECWRYAERARQWAREHGDQEQLTFALTNTCSAAQEPDSTARLCSSPCSPTPVSLAVTSKPRSARRVKRSTPPMRVAPGFRGALARTVLVDALVLSSAPESEIKAVIAEARELVRKSGGNSLLPRLLEAEARLDGRGDRSTLQAGLRAAEAMYRAMGAPDPADRLIKEMSSSVG